MDNFISNNSINQSNSLDKDADKPIPFESGPDESGVSHAPLDLGGGSAAPAPRVSAPKPQAKKPTQNIVPGERITTVKSFFTKLHVNAIPFLDEQINEWLQENPDISIKRTNTVVGEVQAKKTEPNIIITVWY
jgi:hypothetical protein